MDGHGVHVGGLRYPVASDLPVQIRSKSLAPFEICCRNGFAPAQRCLSLAHATWVPRPCRHHLMVPSFKAECHGFDESWRFRSDQVHRGHAMPVGCPRSPSVLHTLSCLHQPITRCPHHKSNTTPSLSLSTGLSRTGCWAGIKALILPLTSTLRPFCRTRVQRGTPTARPRKKMQKERGRRTRSVPEVCLERSGSDFTRADSRTRCRGGRLHLFLEFGRARALKESRW